jgi:hypothetical protein
MYSTGAWVAKLCGYLMGFNGIVLIETFCVTMEL